MQKENLHRGLFRVSLLASLSTYLVSITISLSLSLLRGSHDDSASGWITIYLSYLLFEGW